MCTFLPLYAYCIAFSTLCFATVKHLLARPRYPFANLTIFLCLWLAIHLLWLNWFNIGNLVIWLIFKMWLFVIIIEGTTVRFTVLKNVDNIVDNEERKQLPKEVKLLNKSHTTLLLLCLNCHQKRCRSPKFLLGFRLSSLWLDEEQKLVDWWYDSSIRYCHYSVLYYWLQIRILFFHIITKNVAKNNH